jgi:lysine/ornithine N-monooxygenase
MGGTNTPWRRNWQASMKKGRDEGWYRLMTGTVNSMSAAPDGRIVSSVKTDQGNYDVAADFIIDCTGLEADIAEHRVLKDLLDHGGAARNPKGRLDVERSFELRGTASAPGAMYASGSATLGGYFPGVDTFLGLQVAAQEIADDLAGRGFCNRIGPRRSVSQWLKWAKNKPI